MSPVAIVTASDSGIGQESAKELRRTASTSASPTAPTKQGRKRP